LFFVSLTQTCTHNGYGVVGAGDGSEFKDPQVTRSIP
jgi:hypothetical protein